MASADDGTSSGRGTASGGATGSDDPARAPTVLIQRRSLAWLAAPAALLLLMALFLVYILWPGNLVYSPQGITRLDDDRAREIQSQHNATLENEIRVLQAALRDDVCTASDATGQAGLPLLPGPSDEVPSGDGGSRPTAGETPSAPGDAEPGSPAGGDGAAPQSTDAAPRLPSSTLLSRLNDTTVFIAGVAGPGISTGTGLLVSERHVLTNHHVVDGVAEGTIRVANKNLDRPLGARIVANTPGSPIGGGDFALLELEQAIPAEPLPMAGAPQPLDPVVAAGYPAFVIQSDPEFVAAFQNGELERLNSMQMAFTEGAVTNKQPGAGGVTVIGHSATISQGNSGGPLVDRCGRVVGINTFVRTDAENALRMNFALGATDTAAFLSAHGVAVTLADNACSDAPLPLASAPGPASPPVAATEEGPAAAAEPPADAAPAADGDPPAAPPAADDAAPAPDESASEPATTPVMEEDDGEAAPEPAAAPAEPEPDPVSRDAEADLLMPPPENAE